MGKKEKTLYDVLGVSKDANTREIKQAYRKLALETHPDKNPDSTEDAAVRFNELQRVYQTLVDEEKRRLYDETGAVFGDDDLGDGEISASQLFERLSAMRKPLTKEDIASYERTYREGEEERNDLCAFYNRFKGKVDRVIEYVPFSEDKDIKRFVIIWDDAIKEERLRAEGLYPASKRRLLRKAEKAERTNAKKTERPGDEADDKSMDALAAAIASRGKERFSSLTDRLEAKYGPNGSIAKKSGK